MVPTNEKEDLLVGLHAFCRPVKFHARTRLLRNGPDALPAFHPKETGAAAEKEEKEEEEKEEEEKKRGAITAA